MLSKRAALLSIASILAWTTHAHAQDPTPEKLFEQGRTLLREGKAAEACPKLAESQRQNPSPATVVTLADCYLQLGKIASAWVTYREAAGAAEAAGQTERARYASQRVTELEAKLSRITITLAPGTAADVAIKRDGDDVDPAELGTAIPVDPGNHTVEASAPGRQPWKTTITVGARARQDRVVIPALEAPRPATPAGPVAAPAEEHASTWPVQRTTALIVGGAGVVALGVGSVFGLMTLGDKSDANSHCPTSTTCDAQGYASGQDAHSAATVSTILFVAGGVAVGAGVTLWLTAPKERPAASLKVRVGPRAAALEGTW